MVNGRWLFYSPMPLSAIFGVLFCFSASGAEVHATCDLVQKVSSFQINAMTHLAGAQISSKEKHYLHAHYASLRSECGANPRASRLVAVSPELQSLLSQHGVRIKNKRLILAQKHKKHRRKIA